MAPNRRKKAHGLYYHSSPPKVFQMNGEAKNMVIKPSNIRIWIHDKDTEKLARVLWEGQGMRLRTETSNHPKVKRFLEYLPHVLGLIRDVHTSVIDGDLNSFKSRTAPPVPPQLFQSKDSNGLTLLHKAAGLARTDIVEYLLQVSPGSAKVQDFTGKTPLHWAASAKNNERCFNLLVQAGCDEAAIDNKFKNAAYYKNKPSDIDRTLLSVVPEAPRIASHGFPANFDWNIFSDADAKSYRPPSKSQSDYALNSNIAKKPTRTTSFEVLSTTANLANLANPIVANVVKPTKAINEVKKAVKAVPEKLVEPVQVEEDDHFEAEDVLQKGLSRVTSSAKSNDFNNNEEMFEDEPMEDEKDDNDDVQSRIVITSPKTTSYSKYNGHIKNSRDQDDLASDLEENENVNENSNNLDDSGINDLEDDAETIEYSKEEFEMGTENFDGKSELLADKIESGLLIQEHSTEREELERQLSVEMMENLGDPVALDIERTTMQEYVDELESADIPVEVFMDELPTADQTSDKIEFDQDINEYYAEPEHPIYHEKVVDEPETALLRTEPDAELFVVENNLNEEDDDEEQVESPSPPLEIQGLVSGEPEKQLESQGGGMLQMPINEMGPTQQIIDSGDMEQLAAIVLNGDGKKLIGMRSQQPEIQAFLDNVAAYMNKIRRVHIAAREGSLRDLQSALDRRKFATAKDEISPDGATPLHVAIIFGHTGIIRYLGGRFPETTNATDNEGRTPLHYAATIKDNGHFYNLLMHLGGNPKTLDNLGNSTEFYTEHEQSDSTLSHKQLLKNFGAQEDFADSMLADQEGQNKQVEIPLFRTEEGRYLATSLGDPLVKGLTEVANKRPADPIAFLASYLQNFSVESKTPSTKEAETPHTESSKPESQQRRSSIVQLPSMDNIEEAPPATPEGTNGTSNTDDRDEHGQSILHFSCARSHGRNALLQLIEESSITITYRDELYRTARDVSLQASQPDNAKEIDRYVLSLAARGDYEKFHSMLLDGYDHVVDIVDADEVSIVQVAKSRGNSELTALLQNWREFEENREKVLQAIRSNDFEKVKELLSKPDASKLARAKNYYGRSSMHIAVLLEHEEIVDFLASNFRQTLKIGDNLERTPLHYAMGVNDVEALSRILIKNGAQRVVKDLKGRQPSYYFMNKADILRLQEEEKD